MATVPRACILAAPLLLATSAYALVFEVDDTGPVAAAYSCTANCTPAIEVQSVDDSPVLATAASSGGSASAGAYNSNLLSPGDVFGYSSTTSRKFMQRARQPTPSPSSPTP